MIAVDGFAAEGFPTDDVAQHEFDAGAPVVSADLLDLDGDGHYETTVRHTDAGITVATDVDGDGVTDKFTAFGRDGQYRSWEIFREANGIGRGEMSESGEL
ncbi:hypothetical protein CH294_07290 [Rhodococcus sp. 14-2483-1-1]|uniref:DUF6802 family protein n=1 Tax=Nocardiaceae TaxID=85025 RepID=UPI00068C9EBC|nr:MULTISPECIES: DUF6802 family protein [Rhodococcus]OZC51116.1 hypothetical protein CH286_06225 [Rhodococcus sp. WWJCD1]OZC83510.1 hypothetical protein CH254_21350 [Rhodococcus sp. 06-412-2C]OZC93693.1 hypothetical protein CH279_19430 [Rhodococcus sp. 06-412-2B]OZE84017.1 hypothetical protein CH305_06135 [Rhodococcus sp. 15-649-2-2]OZF39273.1 hypothetical protein CH294_07290 [Rhodococcus sp. 14-2483-1-1]